MVGRITGPPYSGGWRGWASCEAPGAQVETAQNPHLTDSLCPRSTPCPSTHSSQHGGPSIPSCHTWAGHGSQHQTQRLIAHSPPSLRTRNHTLSDTPCCWASGVTHIFLPRKASGLRRLCLCPRFCTALRGGIFPVLRVLPVTVLSQTPVASLPPSVLGPVFTPSCRSCHRGPHTHLMGPVQESPGGGISLQVTVCPLPGPQVISERNPLERDDPTQKLKQTWCPLSWVRTVVKAQRWEVSSSAYPLRGLCLSKRGLVLD